MNTVKAENRDRKRSKKKSGMQMDNRGIFILEEVKVKKAEKAKSKKRKASKNNGDK